AWAEYCNGLGYGRCTSDARGAFFVTRIMEWLGRLGGFVATLRFLEA
ncbi:MAG: hypothetical protein HOP21_11815, partial [Methylotenera sp.]|nr:hypothetical protein [Methylotenera sp.]